MSQGITLSRSSAKLPVVLAIADYIIETYHPEKQPRVLMWREILQGYTSKVAPDLPNEWTRDGLAVFNHWKLYGPVVVKRLEERYKVTIVRVSRRIRDLVNHGDPPKVGGGKGVNERNAVNYRSCLPHSQGGRTMGIVCFPRGEFEDHPLIVAEMTRRGQSSASFFRNTAQRVDRAEGLGVLSTEEGMKVKEQMGKVAREAIKDNHPLFAVKSLDLSPDEPKAIEPPAEAS